MVDLRWEEGICLTLTDIITAAFPLIDSAGPN